MELPSGALLRRSGLGAFVSRNKSSAAPQGEDRPHQRSETPALGDTSALRPKESDEVTAGVNLFL